MYCPNCGKENSVEQKFCRSCGLSLQTISQALVNELSETKSAADSLEIVKRARKSWQSPLMYGFLTLMLGLIIATLGKKILDVQAVTDIGTIIALLGIGLIGFKGVMLIIDEPESLPSSKATAELETKTKLPPELQAREPASITEHTTRSFEPIYNKRKAE